MNDPQDMLGIVRDSPSQWASALATAQAAEVRPVDAPRAVVIAGMGGSGIAGDVARLAADLTGTAPVVAVKGYEPPRWLGPDTAVIAVSHSGNTEETLAFVDAAHRAGAPGHVVTSGGSLAQWASTAGWSATIVPGGMQPRASLPSLTTPVLTALAGWGVIAPVVDDLAALPALLAPEVAADIAGQGVGRALADRVKGRAVVFLGGRGVGALVAQRGACQIAENAEEKAFGAELPEFDHNALVGFATDNLAGSFVVIPVYDPGDHERVAARFAPTLAVLAGSMADAQGLRLVSGTWIARLARGVLDVDLASVHLALHLDRDPTPVDVLVALKQTLAASGPQGANA